MHPDDTAPSAGFTLGNRGAGVDKIFHARIARPLREDKPRQRRNRVDSTVTLSRDRGERVTEGRHAPAVLLAPSSFAET